jgi:DNA-binding CsgD family transcriptional regulator
MGKQRCVEPVRAKTFELLDQLDSTASPEEFLRLVGQVLEGYGFTAFVLTGLPRPGANAGPDILINGWPGGWMERYAEANHFSFDPVARRCMETVRTFAWTEIPADYLSDPRAAVIPNEAAEFDLRQGLCVPIHGPLGVGGLSLAGQQVELAPEVRSMARLLAHQLMDLSARAPLRPSSALSPRERDVLSWTAAGKTVEDVGTILGISRHTVGEHLKSVRRKLQTVNSAHSVVRALQRGELTL